PCPYTTLFRSKGCRDRVLAWWLAGYDGKARCPTAPGPWGTSALEAGHDLRHVEAQLQLHAHVVALLARQRATSFDAHVFRVQDADDLRHGRTDGVGAVARFAEGGAEEVFSVHGRS